MKHQYGTAFEKAAAKDVSLKTRGQEKVRVSVCLTVRRDEIKLKPLIAFARP